IGGHGYAPVRVTGDEMRTEFVCIPPPITRAATPDGGRLRYRIVHTAKLWRSGERPQLTEQVLEGDPGLSISSVSAASRAGSSGSSSPAPGPCSRSCAP